MKTPETRRSRIRTASEQSSKKTSLTYYRSGKPNTNSSPFEKDKKPKNKIGKIFSRLLDFSILAVVILCLVYSLMVKADPTIDLNSEVYRNTVTYKKFATQQLQQLKNHSKLTLDDAKIINSLQKKLPEISSANIELPLFSQTPTVHINVSSPAFFINSAGSIYIVDSKGTAVARASEFPNIKNLPLLKDETGFTVAKGEQVIGAGSVDFIKTLAAQSKKANVQIASLTLPSLAQELDLRTTDQPYFVKFYLNGDAMQQTGQFLATRKQLQQSNIHPAEYLDVRVPGKIFYK